MIEWDTFSSLTLIACDFREFSDTVISTDSTLIKIKNTLFDLDSSEIRNNDRAVEIMASDEEDYADLERRSTNIIDYYYENE